MMTPSFLAEQMKELTCCLLTEMKTVKLLCVAGGGGRDGEQVDSLGHLSMTSILRGQENRWKFVKSGVQGRGPVRDLSENRWDNDGIKNLKTG